MLLQENRTRFCVDEKVFTVGGRVMANDASEYAGLCGTVAEIRSGADRERRMIRRIFIAISSRLPRRKCSASWRHAFQTYTERQKP